MDVLKSLGFSPEQIDLRNYFGKPQELKKYLSNFGLVWVYGGNAFVLKRAYEQSGFDKIIKDMLLKDEIVYTGFSAGIVILSKSLKGLEIVDDTKRSLEGADKIGYVTILFTDNEILKAELFNILGVKF